MRTTVRLNDQLLAEVRQVAVRTRRTLTAVIEDALREMLARQQRQPRRSRIRLTTVGGRGVLRGVDLDDTASLLDLLDRPNAAD
ncbi:MAG: type II toxin-antitoxin system VapB family antitoxin [Acidobacteria bacterium]|nr:type II toxin-antitoxin system VapB family antitoxin [Acidobacteriota bacterium]